MNRRLFGQSMAGAMAGAVVGTLAARAEEGEASGWELGPFVKAGDVNPVLGPGEGEFVCPVRGEAVRFEEKDVFNPAAVVRDNKVYLLYRAEDKVGRYKGTSRIGLASSDDGLHFTRRSAPVLYPDNDAFKRYEWEGGCEDPRIVEDEAGNYVLTYTAFNGRKGRLCTAASADLVTWKKHGPVFGGRYADMWSKSGAIVCRREGERIIAVKVRGRYWMYWGVGNIYLAHSQDLLDWAPVESGPAQWLQGLSRGHGLGPDKGRLLPALMPRPHKFDSVLVEPGPPALLTERGIRLLYNGVNRGRQTDPAIPAHTYSSGQALFAADDPSRLIARIDHPFLKPDKDFELKGQVNNVCFIEGLVFFQGRWLLYYGAADSRIGVAVAP